MRQQYQHYTEINPDAFHIAFSTDSLEATRSYERSIVAAERRKAEESD